MLVENPQSEWALQHNGNIGQLKLHSSCQTRPVHSQQRQLTLWLITAALFNTHTCADTQHNWLNPKLCAALGMKSINITTNMLMLIKQQQHIKDFGRCTE